MTAWKRHTDDKAKEHIKVLGELGLSLSGAVTIFLKDGKSLEAWQVDGDPKPFISQLVQCVDQEERAVAEIVGRLRENPFSENAIDGIGLEDGPARGRSL